MNTRKFFIGTGVAAATLAGAFVAVSTVWPSAPGYAAGVIARQVHFGGEAGWRHERPHGLAMICSDRREHRLEAGLAFVEGFVNFTPEQTAAWTELADAVRGGSASIGEACAELDLADTSASAPERLARFETLAATGVDILRRVRPAFDRFYATLSDTQKQAIDDLIAHRGRRT
jgi:hypothetical protein